MGNVCRIIVLCSLTFFLFSCSNAQEAEPTADLVATQVAVILTETALHEVPSATETMIPSATAVPVEATQKPTLSPTPTMTDTQTQIPSDPSVLLGSPVWIHDFSGASSPWDYESEEAVFSTSNGYLNVTARAIQNYHSWWVSSPRLEDAYVEITMMMDACAGFDRFGFAVRGTSDGEQFYFLDLTCDGRWGFFRMAPDVEIIEIKAYNETNILTDGWTEPHRVGIWLEDTNFRFYIDGEEIGVASDDELTDAGYIGFMIAFAETPGYTVRVDQLQYWNIP